MCNSEEDTELAKKAVDHWFASTDHNLNLSKEEQTERWKAQREVYKIIEEKYYPKQVIYCGYIDCEVNEDVKQGIIDYLWNTDACAYSLDKDDIGIKKGDYWVEITFIYKWHESE